MNLKLPYNRGLEVINIKYLYNDNIKYLISLLGNSAGSSLVSPLHHYKTKMLTKAKFNSKLPQRRSRLLN